MTTAKVAYVHKENPYLVMPVEIPNEPWLGFTRAANKVALYGPTWLLMTWLPLVLGMGNPLLTVYAFKLIPLAGYVCMLVLIQRITREPRNVLFFGLNPLVLTETLVAAHNDIIMMDLAILAILLASSERFTSRITGFVCLIASVFIKGATLILLPLVVLRKRIKVSLFDAGFWLMLFVFFLSPLREELYPWYAVWFLSFAACIPFKKGSFIHYFSIFLSLGLSFRHVPYIVTREYGGVGPLLRLVVTIVPPALYAAFLIMRKKRIQLFPSHG